MVESGSFNEVPNATKRPASTKLIEARTKSKAAPCSMILSSVLKRLFTHDRTEGGVTVTTQLEMMIKRRTNERATREEPNISSPTS